MDNLNFIAKSFVVHTGSAAGDVGDGIAAHDGDNGRGRCGVADTEFSGSEHFHAFFIDGFVSQVNAGFDGRDGLFPGHGRTFAHVFAAMGDFVIDDDAFFRKLREIFFNSHVYQTNLNPCGAAEDVDTGTAQGDVFHHFNGHFLREGRHAFIGNTVIGSHGEDHFL